MNNHESALHTPSYWTRLWLKLPVLVQAILTGFLVSSLGVGAWLLAVIFIPPPWSIIVMVPVLWLYWKYFGGEWWPETTRSFRKMCFRKTKLKTQAIAWSTLAGFLLFVFLNAGLVLTFRLVEFQPEIFKTATYLDNLPAPLAWAFIIMASMVAGVCEEIGFRGYMQVPLEKKYGPVAGISITSVIFVIVHLHQAWAGGILFQIFVISFMAGYLAYATNSLIPGIITHLLFDIVNFSYWWSNVAGSFSYKPINVTGADLHFFITLSITLLSALLFIFTINKLLFHKKSESFGPRSE